MTILSKKDVRKCYVNWITFALGCQNMERMMAPAFVRMFGLVSEKLYDSKEEQQKLLDRHTQFFNTEEAFGSIIPGVILGMEEKRAEGEEIPDELIQSTKTALMGPFAGMGDSLIGGTLRPILCSIAMGLSFPEPGYYFQEAISLVSMLLMCCLSADVRISSQERQI